VPDKNTQKKEFSNMAGSEIARLLQRIREEEEAARRGLEEYAVMSKHQFITARMENINRCIEQLVAVTGSEETATNLILTNQNQNHTVSTTHVTS
jgi:hypothetical protein